jgi:hypothetical protein|tara:strand:- start:298 stop:483 length:186 start_codon:yes stop_codon:yes gene_type:complete
MKNQIKYPGILYGGKFREFNHEMDYKMPTGEDVRFFRSEDKEYFVKESEIIKLLREQKKEE